MAKSKKDPYELVRVKLPSGAETTLARTFAERKKYRILDGKPVTRHGRKLGFKPKTSLPRAQAPEGSSTTNPGGDSPAATS